MQLIITVDTEGDNQWKRTPKVGIDNIRFIPRFQELCNSYGFKPTYLCTYEILEAAEFDETLNAYRARGEAEIGAHLHPWTNPPFSNEYDCCTEIDRSPYPTELPLGLFADKMELLTERIRSRTGGNPTSYRAGRWGFDASHIEPLLQLGYRVDCSVTPYISWETHAGRAAGGPDFSRARNGSYYLSDQDVCESGDSRLLEVPVTILSPSRLMDSSFLRDRYRQARGTAAARALNKVLPLEPRWLRPYPKMTAGDLIDVFAAACRRRLPFAEMMFHSSELMPGGSPYYPTSESVQSLFERLDALFRYVAGNGGQGVTLSEFESESRAHLDREGIRHAGETA